MPAVLPDKRKEQVNTLAPPVVRAGLFHSPVMWALAVFAIINVWLWNCVHLNRSSNDLWSGSGSIDLALQELAALNQRPNVVLLGSSLVMFPFWAMDKEADASIGDIFHHHRSRTLETQLMQSTTVSQMTVFNLATFGQMTSDAYIYAEEFLKGDRRPDYLVLGTAPRDFSDADLPAPMATMTFKHLVGWGNFGRYAPLYLPGFHEKADFIAAHSCFFYGNRWHLQKEVSKAVNKVYALLGLLNQPSKAGSNPGQAGFMLTGSNEERWKNSAEEYRRRYHNIGSRDLAMQMGFLERLLQVCRDRKIKTVIVNMPLTDINRGLFPPEFYDRFCNQLKLICARYRGRFVDLGSSNEFVHDDFWDTAHLNHHGGHKLIRHLAPDLVGGTQQ